MVLIFDAKPTNRICNFAGEYGIGLRQRGSVSSFEQAELARVNLDSISLTRLQVQCRRGQESNHHWYACIYRHLEDTMAWAEIRKAEVLDPISLITNTNEGWIFNGARVGITLHDFGVRLSD